MAIKQVAENKKARFDYELLETYEAGIELAGPEVKSVKLGHVSIKEAFVVGKDKELWFINGHISPYNPATSNNVDPKRSRKLLLKRSEIDHLISKVQTAGLTIVPVKMYLKNGLIKLEIALAKGKKTYNKKEVMKQRDIDLDAKREIKERF